MGVTVVPSEVLVDGVPRTVLTHRGYHLWCVAGINHYAMDTRIAWWKCMERVSVLGGCDAW